MQTSTLSLTRRDRYTRSLSDTEDSAIGIAAIWLVFYLVVFAVIATGKFAPAYMAEVGRIAALE